jgi:hypothetical protein
MAFFEYAPAVVTQRLEHYLNIGMFIRRVPYDEEREAIKYLPYLRVVPFQLARKLILTDVIKDRYDEYDLVWNDSHASDLYQYLTNNVSNYRKQIS